MLYETLFQRVGILDGSTALHLACQEGFAACITPLVTHGADVNAVRTDDESTPWDVALMSHHLDCANILHGIVNSH